MGTFTDKDLKIYKEKVLKQPQPLPDFAAILEACVKNCFSQKHKKGHPLTPRGYLL